MGIFVRNKLDGWTVYRHRCIWGARHYTAVGHLSLTVSEYSLRQFTEFSAYNVCSNYFASIFWAPSTL